MPPLDSPVQTRIPIPVPDAAIGGGRTGSGGLRTRPVGRRRIFVQTDTGSVLGIELDGAASAQSVKKKMQTLLNEPTEQTALVFGDTVFKGDLSELRNDSPLLLTRELQRSLSTPCIYPLPDLQGLTEGGQPFEVVGGLICCQKMERILKDINKAISCGVEPVAVSGGLGGAYYFRNSSGENIAIVKPTDEELFAPNNPKGLVGRRLGQPGLKNAVRVGETGVREVAAYLLDHKRFAKVPPTVLVKVAHPAFHVNSDAAGHKGSVKARLPVSKIASCQQFVPHDCDASDHGTSRFSVAAVHRIGILDIRIFNTDRHAGNILIKNARPLDSHRTWKCSSVHVNESLELIPIDHGLCLPEALEDPYFEWLHWPQSSLPFSEEELDYINGLEEYKDAEMLRRELPMLREACFRILILSTTLLKRAAAAGFCLAEIGEMMSRDGIEEASQLELLCMEAKLLVEDNFSTGKMCQEEINGDATYSEYSLGEDLHEQFEVEMDPEFDNKFGATDAVPFYLRKDVSVDLLPFGYSFMAAPSAPSSEFSYLPSPSVPTRALQSSRFPLQVLHEVMGAEEEDSLSSPCIASVAGRGPWVGGSGSLQRLTLGSRSDSRSPRGARPERSPRLRADFCPLVEEEEVHVSADVNEGTYKASQRADLGSPSRWMSYRSVSFHNRKQRYSDCFERKATASETTGKVNVNGGATPISLGDMNEAEWASFMAQFEDLLREALATKRDQRHMSHNKQRLGISCQF